MFSHPRRNIIDGENARINILVLVRGETYTDTRAVLMFDVAQLFALGPFPNETELERQPDFLTKIQKRATVRNVANDAANWRTAGNPDDGVFLCFPAAKRAPLDT
jgi:hypothetical protein